MDHDTTCVNCGTMLPADAVHDPVDARTPCPTCGATARRFHLGGAVTVTSSGSASMTVIPSKVFPAPAQAGVAQAVAQAFDATVEIVEAPDAPPTRVAERHLTILADRLEQGGVLVRLVDEDDPRDIDQVYLAEYGDGDDLALDLALRLRDLLGPYE